MEMPQAFFLFLQSSFFLTISRRDYRQRGRVSGLQNLTSENTFSVDFVNDCEEKCLRTQECSYYEFDCITSQCYLKKLDTSQEQNFIQNDCFITGTADDDVNSFPDNDKYRKVRRSLFGRTQVYYHTYSSLLPTRRLNRFFVCLCLSLSLFVVQ